jgi:hypothetical protein
VEEAVVVLVEEAAVDEVVATGGDSVMDGKVIPGV